MEIILFYCFSGSNFSGKRSLWVNRFINGQYNQISIFKRSFFDLLNSFLECKEKQLLIRCVQYEVFYAIRRKIKQ